MGVCSCKWWTHGVSGKSSQVDATAIPCGVEEQPGNRSLQSWDTPAGHFLNLRGEYFVSVVTTPPHCYCLSIFPSTPAMNSNNKIDLSMFSPQVRLPKIPMIRHFFSYRFHGPITFWISWGPFNLPFKNLLPGSLYWSPPVSPTFSIQPVGLLSFPKQCTCLPLCLLFTYLEHFCL